MKRILSIDIFRGLTIFVMVFVNDLAGVSGLPAWMYHVPVEADAMTFVDVVFPAFLIIVGMSIPLAITRRFSNGDSVWQVMQHIAIRSVGLIVLGVFMVNAQEMNREENLISPALWNVLLYLGAILIWNQYPRDNPNRQRLYRGLQLVGILILLILAVLFRKGDVDNLTGMTPSWWGILGLIGWAYLISTAVYLICRNHLSAIVSVFALLIIASVGLKNPDLLLPSGLGWVKAQTGHIVHGYLTISGIILTLLLQKGANDSSETTPLKWILVTGALCMAAGYFIRPFYGISKIFATPTWALYSIAASCLVYALIHYLVQVKDLKRWANFLKPAGMNPLLTYILPFVFYAVVGFSYLPNIFNHGVTGFLRSVVFSLFILWIASLLTKRGIRLKL